MIPLLLVDDLAGIIFVWMYAVPRLRVRKEKAGEALEGRGRREEKGKGHGPAAIEVRFSFAFTPGVPVETLMTCSPVIV